MLLPSSTYQALNAESKDVLALQVRLDELQKKEAEVIGLLGDMDTAFALRRAPFEDELKALVHEKQILNVEMAAMMAPPSVYPPAPGPAHFRFVDSGWFSLVCNAVVVFNLACMAFASRLQAYHSILYALDQLFLAWYTVELIAKWKYHQRNLFFGNVYIVWWNWMDAGIVIAGIVDQWMLALVRDMIPFRIPALSWLRCLRFFRVMRFLKVLKALVHGDLSWTEEPPFQVFMSAVIAVNSVVLTFELDTDWVVWNWCEQVFLIVYTFEVAVRLKEFGCKFFVNADFVWNNLDFAMVCGGVFDLWLMPAWYLTQSILQGTVAKHDVAIHNLLKIIKMAKILRVLRLVRLLRMVKPLYTLLVGVMSALDAMKWVMILTFFLLYAGAIVFTSLIGHGYIYRTPEDIPEEAETMFGTVPQSFFSLFKLMNGDVSVVLPITQDIKGRLLFAGFMILSNWAVLAILTSVVSENMIITSQRLEQEDKLREEEEHRKYRTRQLSHFFSRVDTNIDGKISKSEWDTMLHDSELSAELGELTSLDKTTLKEVFYCLSEEVSRRYSIDDNSSLGDDQKHYHPEEYLTCTDFIAHLNADREGADRRQILHLRYWLEKVTLQRIQELEQGMQNRFADLEAILTSSIAPDKTKQDNDRGIPVLKRKGSATHSRHEFRRVEPAARLRL